MWYALCVLGGVVIGLTLSFLARRKSADPPVGDLVFDKSLLIDFPYLAIQRQEDLDLIRAKKYVKLRVRTVNSNSHK